MSWRVQVSETIIRIRLTSDEQPCLRRVVRGADDLQRRRIFDFPSERGSKAYVVSIDRNAARVYRIRTIVLTPGHPEVCSYAGTKTNSRSFSLRASLRHSMGFETWQDVAGLGLAN